MRLISLVLVLLITQLTGWISCAESSEENDQQNRKKCPGGYCVKIHLCRNGTINTEGEDLFEPRFGDDDNSIRVSVDPEDHNPCVDFLMICCALENVDELPSASERQSTDEELALPPPSCGSNHPEGYFYRSTGSTGHTPIAQFAEFPWMAALLERKTLLDKQVFEYFCGGSLIHQKVVLTAAHCMLDRNVIGDVEVRLGEWDTVTENELLKHQQYGVSKMIVHENFVKKKLHNDLALLILVDKVNMDKHINPICLPSADDNFDEKRCMVSGWGKENFNSKEPGRYADVLKKVEVPVVPRGQCKRIFRTTRLGPFFQLDPSFMCAGGEAGVDVCKGDGGSPLACKSGDRFVQAGIVAWGLGCGENGIPGAYVKVSNFVNWIRTTLQREGIDV